MRVSTLQMHHQAIDNMMDTSRQIADTQQQISSGRRFVTPADDPVAAARTVGLNQELAVRGQYQRNIQLATGQLGLEDAALSQASEVLQRVRELALSASNATLSASDRSYIGAEIGTRLDELMSIMNSRTANGEYIFAGFKGRTQPFVRVGTADVVYQGDEGQRKVQVAASSSIAVNDSGKRIFMDVPTVAVTFTASAHAGNASAATIAGGGVANQSTVDAFFPDKLVVEFDPPGADPQGRATFTVRRQSDGRVVDGLTAVPYTAGDPIEAAGMRFRIFGEPAAGDRFVVETTRQQSVATTIAQLADGLSRLGNSDSDLGKLSALVDGSIGNLDQALDSILQVRAEIGARLNTADSSDTLHQDVELVTKDLLSKLRDVDYADAVSRLNIQTVVLEAAQKSYTRVSGLSLFNFL